MRPFRNAPLRAKGCSFNDDEDMEFLRVSLCLPPAEPLHPRALGGQRKRKT